MHLNTQQKPRLSTGNLKRMELSYLGNVLLHPLKQLPLVQQTSVEVAILLDFLTRQEPKSAHTVIEVHEYEIITRISNQMCSIMVASRTFDDIAAVIVRV